MGEKNEWKSNRRLGPAVVVGQHHEHYRLGGDGRRRGCAAEQWFTWPPTLEGDLTYRMNITERSHH